MDEHPKHPARDHETADDIDHRQDDCEKAENVSQKPVGRFDRESGRDEAPEDGDAGKGVHARHQRRMQEARNLIDDQVANDHRNKEHSQQDVLYLGHPITSVPSPRACPRARFCRPSSPKSKRRFHHSNQERFSVLA